MHTHINIGPGIADKLQASLKRQLQFKVASLSASIHSLNVNLTVAPREAGAEPWYHCRIEARLHNGASVRASMQGSQPNMCIADAASRLARKTARSLTRTRQWQRLGVAPVKESRMAGESDGAVNDSLRP